MLGLMKSLIFVVGFTIFMASLIMAFELPTHKETLSAIGSTNALKKRHTIGVIVSSYRLFYTKN